jgi:serine/threonine protein kinase
VLDFGLVKTQGPAAEADPGLTAPNMVSGTPAYLSPESALGEAVDQRSDIYALGCVAYWMLTGRYVFEAQGVLQIVSLHIHSTPDPPSRHSAFPVSQELDEIILACLAKRPSDRPASARELADRLSQCDMPSPWTREEAMRWWETRLEPEAAVALTD